MARPLRIEFAGALYHLTSRGNERQRIFRDDWDRQSFLTILAEVQERYGWMCYAYCLMDNHYHLMVETPEPNLARGMKLLNGCHTQKINRRYDRVGHLFQGRYKSILVDRDVYMKELARYIVLNPVRAGLIDHPAQWRWSSYRATTGTAPSPEFLVVETLLLMFGDSVSESRTRFQAFVEQGMDGGGLWQKLTNQIYLGPDEFVEEARTRIAQNRSLRDIPRRQSLPPAKPIEYFRQHFPDDREAMVEAYLSGHFTLDVVGKEFGVSRSTVSRAVNGRRMKHDEKLEV
jgi:REP-associated tyrosine transposase